MPIVTNSTQLDTINILTAAASQNDTDLIFLQRGNASLKVAKGNLRLNADQIQNVNNLRVIGNVSGSQGDSGEVVIYDEDDMSSDSDTGLATQQSIKAYADAITPFTNYALFVQDGVTHQMGSGTWKTNAQLTQSVNSMSGDVSISGGVISVAAGTYQFDIWASYNDINNNYNNYGQMALMTESDNTVHLKSNIGRSYNDYNIWTTRPLRIIGRVTFGGATDIALKTRSTNGYIGLDTNTFGIGGVACSFQMWKL